jgi:O-antigen/teichoic acid export membrane protein
MGHTKEVVKGVSWTGAIRVVIRILSFLKTIIIARILTPFDFGLFSIGTLILTLIEILTETGVNIFLVQRKEDIDKFINTSWMVSIVRGALISLALIITAPLVAQFFRTPSSLGLLLLISVVPFVRGFINPSIVKFQKELKFHKQFYYSTSIFLVETLVSIALVILTRSVYSLVWAMIISALFEVLISLIVIKPTPRLEFELPLFKRVFNSGKWITASTIFNYFYQHSDDMVVGRLLGSGSLGLYDMVYRISLVPLTDIGDVLATVTFPVYVRISEDKKRLRRAFFRTLGVVILLVVPVGGVLFLFPEFIIKLVLGEKWIAAAPVLRVLGIFGIVRSISSFGSTVFLSIEKQNISMIISFVGFLGLAFTIVPLVMAFGIVGAAVSALIGTSLTIPVIVYFIYKHFYEE